jgi:hypothetical protein
MNLAVVWKQTVDETLIIALLRLEIILQRRILVMSVLIISHSDPWPLVDFVKSAQDVYLFF